MIEGARRILMEDRPALLSEIHPGQRVSGHGVQAVVTAEFLPRSHALGR